MQRLLQKTLSERTANGSCRTEIAPPKGIVVSMFGTQKKNEFFAGCKTDTAVRRVNWLRLITTVHQKFGDKAFHCPFTNA